MGQIYQVMTMLPLHGMQQVDLERVVLVIITHILYLHPLTDQPGQIEGLPQI